ncbi:lyase family protein [Longivirga aurantiaca]|uniref:argininosuccinate lyase n=1 Tax=Longivirga aurantiaca TaxID=1837743 RepID=A0ABW1T5F5_9ACTN
MKKPLGSYAPELVEAGFALEVDDAPLLHHWLNVADLAHVVVLREQGLVPAAAAARLVDVLVEADAVPAEAFGYDPVNGELYNCRERRFAQQIGEDAGWLHVARTRREAVRVAVRLRLRQDVLDLVEAAAGFCAATSEAAGRYATTYLADQTYLQHAQPSTFGHYLLAFVPPVERDLQRLLAELDLLGGSPAGVGSTNGGRLGYDRGRAAELLGFDRVLEHTRDAMWQTDGLVAAVSAATSLVVSLSKLAEDLEIWASDEFAWVELADGHARSSVMMPQKRNPYALGMVRAHAGVLIGRLTGLLATSRTPSARSDGLIVAYGEVPRALSRATLATRLMTGVVGGLRADEAAMSRALNASFTQATDIAEHVMSTRGLDYRSAYEVVAHAVRATAADGGTGRDITAARLDAAATAVLGAPLGIAPEELADVVDPVSIVATRTGIGGAAPATVGDMADRFGRAAADRLAAAQDQRSRLATVEVELVRIARDGAQATPQTAGTTGTPEHPVHDPDRKD